ncbi:DUF1176 domain-containing protein [Phenylobacterium conjunctum]|uniref:DUF1176 domain-containing protein n=1 Tax=Phenylobacterium conjunctum TaxID=1298959 RepID=A0ABW3T421_9CAUL
MSGRSWLAAAVAVVGLMGGRAEAASASFKDWTVVCDNVRHCTAFGFASYEDDTLGYLRLERDGVAGAPVRLTVAVADEEMRGKAWTLALDGQAIPGLAGLKAKDPEEGTYPQVSLDPAQAALLAGKLVSGQSLKVTGAEGRAGRISLAGSSAALRWMDVQQKRAGTVTALVAKGDRPASEVPAPPAPPLVTPGVIPSQEGLSDVLPRSVRAKFPPECERNLTKDMTDPIVARLSPGVVLWGDVCSVAAYQSTYVMFLADEKGRNPRPLVLTDAEGRSLGFPDIGFAFDPERLTLSNFYKGRGLADCGGASSWVWDGKAFRLVEGTFMDLCRGLAPDDWPVSYVSRSQ